jgi:hypothetical protein
MIYQLNLTLGEGDAKVLVSFRMYGCDYEAIDWESLEVWYKNVNIADTLTADGLESIDKQINNSWYELERQYDGYDGW